jgi:hypothetical protein
MPRRASCLAISLLLFASGMRCASPEDERTAYPVALSDGTYRATYGQGLPAADEARLLAVTATLDRAGGRLAFTLADGSQRVMTFSPRPRDQWKADCATMRSWVVEEVADLSPAPLRLESLVLETPVVFAKCDPRVMILANGPRDEDAFLKLERR